MRPINAIFLTLHVKDGLANSRHPHILHVFDQVCNLINERREVLSIVTPQIGNGPFNLVVEDDVPFSEYLYVDSPVSILDDQIRLGDLLISTERATFWNPHLNWKVLHAKQEVILDRLMSLPGTNYQPLLPNSLLTTLSLALVNGNISSAVETTSQLAGLGSGLTPAGDDFIMGAVLAAWIIHPPEVAMVLAEEITKIAAPLTTSLSAAWLRAAGKGEAGILWHQFFEALVSAEPAQIRGSMENILAIGETSGADALAGFFGTFLALNNLLLPRSQDEPIHFIQR